MRRKGKKGEEKESEIEGEIVEKSIKDEKEEEAGKMTRNGIRQVLPYSMAVYVSLFLIFGFIQFFS